MRESHAKGFTLIELLIVVAIIAVVAAIAVPSLLRSRMSGNEASAIGSMRAIISAQQDYNAFHSGYATDLANLAAACPGSPIPFISQDLSENGVTKNGYAFELAESVGAIDGPDDCLGAVTQDRFYASATPSAPGFTGNRAFASNVLAAIWEDSSGVPPAEPFVEGGTTSPLGH